MGLEIFFSPWVMGITLFFIVLPYFIFYTFFKSGLKSFGAQNILWAHVAVMVWNFLCAVGDGGGVYAVGASTFFICIATFTIIAYWIFPILMLSLKLKISFSWATVLASMPYLLMAFHVAADYGFSKQAESRSSKLNSDVLMIALISAASAVFLFTIFFIKKFSKK